MEVPDDTLSLIYISMMPEVGGQDRRRSRSGKPSRQKLRKERRGRGGWQAYAAAGFDGEIAIPLPRDHFAMGRPARRVRPGAKAIGVRFSIAANAAPRSTSFRSGCLPSKARSADGRSIGNEWSRSNCARLTLADDAPRDCGSRSPWSGEKPPCTDKGHIDVRLYSFQTSIAWREKFGGIDRTKGHLGGSLGTACRPIRTKQNS